MLASGEVGKVTPPKNPFNDWSLPSSTQIIIVLKKKSFHNVYTLCRPIVGLLSLGLL